MAATVDPAPRRDFLGDLVERKPALAAVGLVALTLLTHVALLAAPGFYGNDEWQKFDHIRLHGFLDYVQAYGAVRPGPEFGYPVRPLGFLQQGVAALWMQSAPYVSHLVSVLNHALVALAFVWVLRRARVPGDIAVLAGVLFVLSPLASATSGLPITYTSLLTANCTVSGNTVTMVQVGACNIEAAQDGNANYLPANDFIRGFSISKGTQTITFPTQAAQSFVDGGTFVMMNSTQNPIALSPINCASLAA